MPGDGITDVACIAQSQQVGLPPQGAKLGVQWHVQPLSLQGWMTQPGLITATQYGVHASESASRLLLDAPPRLSLVRPEWRGESSYLTLQAQSILTPSIPPLTYELTNQWPLAPPPKLDVARHVSPTPQDGWVVTTATQAPAAFTATALTSEVARALLVPPVRLDVRRHVSPTPQDGWITLAAAQTLAAYTVTALTQGASRMLLDAPAKLSLVRPEWRSMVEVLQQVRDLRIQQSMAAAYQAWAPQWLLARPPQLDVRTHVDLRPQDGWVQFVTTIPDIRPLLAAITAFPSQMLLQPPTPLSLLRPEWRGESSILGVLTQNILTPSQMAMSYELVNQWLLARPQLLDQMWHVRAIPQDGWVLFAAALAQATYTTSMWPAIAEQTSATPWEMLLTHAYLARNGL